MYQLFIVFGLYFCNILAQYQVANILITNECLSKTAFIHDHSKYTLVIKKSTKFNNGYLFCIMWIQMFLSTIGYYQLSRQNFATAMIQQIHFFNFRLINLDINNNYGPNYLRQRSYEIGFAIPARIFRSQSIPKWFVFSGPHKS